MIPSRHGQPWSTTGHHASLFCHASMRRSACSRRAQRCRSATSFDVPNETHPVQAISALGAREKWGYLWVLYIMRFEYKCGFWGGREREREWDFAENTWFYMVLHGFVEKYWLILLPMIYRYLKRFIVMGEPWKDCASSSNTWDNHQNPGFCNQGYNQQKLGVTNIRRNMEVQSML